MTHLSEAFTCAAEVLGPTLASTDPKEALIAAKSLGLLEGYDRRWRNAPYLIDAVECVMTSDLYNPETGRKSRTFTSAGKIDVRATEMLTGAKVIFDHKTCSQDITDPNGTYWQQLVIEGQVSHYLLLEWLNANKVDFGLWDVIRKPMISPKGISKADAVAMLEAQTYFGHALDAAEIERAVDGTDAKGNTTYRETPLMYAARLANDCTTERPEWYFQRRQVPRLDAEIREYAQDLWDNGQDILATRNSGRHPRNSGACFTYNSPCGFLGLCSGHDTLDSGNWSTRAWVHPELGDPENFGIPDPDGNPDILTNSRVRCFQTCRQKHHFRYELGIERIDEDEKESLFFGNLMHSALEQYFLALQRVQQTGRA